MFEIRLNRPRSLGCDPTPMSLLLNLSKIEVIYEFNDMIKIHIGNQVIQVYNNELLEGTLPDLVRKIKKEMDL